jgi:hypothetical protein
MTTDTVRTSALAVLKRRADFKNYLITWLGVTIIVTAFWALTGYGDFWPGLVIFGMGIGAFVSGLRAYGPANRIVTDEQIDAELAKANRGTILY